MLDALVLGNGDDPRDFATAVGDRDSLALAYDAEDLAELGFGLVDRIGELHRNEHRPNGLTSQVRLVHGGFLVRTGPFPSVLGGEGLGPFSPRRACPTDRRAVP